MAVSAGHASSEYRPDIDGLRAVAVLAVVVYHAKASLLPGGFVGVDIFFVISGFLISGIILQRLSRGSFTFRDFYARRIRRIFPALSLVLCACLAAGWFLLLPRELEDLGGDVAAGAGFVSNIRFWTQLNYFGPGVASKPLLHLWSLGIEEQYYLVWPLLLVLLWRLRHRLLPIVALLVASLLLSLYLSATDPQAAFYSPFTRLWELLLGSVIAYITLTHGDPVPLAVRLGRGGAGPGNAALVTRVREACSWTGLALIGVTFATLHSSSMFPGFWALLPTVGTALLICAGPETWINRTILSHRLMVGVGLISYPLYLWHWPVLAFLRLQSPEGWYVAKLLGLAGGFVAAYLTYRLLEQRIRRAGGARAVAVLCGLQALLLGAGFVVMAREGFPNRGDAVHRRIYAVNVNAPETAVEGGRAVDPLSTGCVIFWNELEFPPPCFGVPARVPGRPLVLLWGDSFAAHWRPGLRHVLGDSVTIAQLTSAGCAPILDFVDRERPNCAAINRLVLAHIAEARPDAVVVGGRWNAYKGYAEVARTLVALKELGIPRVILLGSSAQYGQSVARLMLLALSRGPAPTRLTPAMLPRLGQIDDELRRVADSTGTEFVAPLEVECSAEGCLVALDTAAVGITVRDDGHLTTAGAVYFAERLFGAGILP